MILGRRCQSVANGVESKIFRIACFLFFSEMSQSKLLIREHGFMVVYKGSKFNMFFPKQCK